MTLDLLVSLLAVAGFGFGLWRLKILSTARDAIAAALEGLSAMLDGALDDDAKEQALRQSGIRLIGSAWGIAWRFALAIVAALLPLVIADLVGLAARADVLELMFRADYIIVVSIVAILVGEGIRRSVRRKSSVTDRTEGESYGAVDRLFHMVAFSSPAVARFASRLEDRLVSRNTPGTDAPPIFVTSLARGGTTALLNALHDVPQLAMHTYRDMPFLTAPVLWDRVNGGKRRAVNRRARAHGDGMEIDLDSPEAFEEAIWKMLWPEKYTQHGIELWPANAAKPEADQFLKDHMNKIVSARRKEAVNDVRPARYCSKNNSNIARLPYLKSSFPDCQIIVPLRRPESHAASLLRQHQNFCLKQNEDSFVARYMRDIGHFEFGLIHKPILFDGFEQGRYDPFTPDYWLSCWIAAFETVRASRSDCIIVTQDALRKTPQDTMLAVCRHIQIDPNGIDFRSHFRQDVDVAPTDVFSRELYRKAEALYDDLSQDSVL